MRDKLIELLQGMHNAVCDAAVGWLDSASYADQLNVEADYLIAHGVTFANVPDICVGKWIPVSERLPEPFVSVLVQMPDEEPCPTVREGYLTNNGTWYAAHFEREQSEVTHWMPMPEFHSKAE